MSALINGHEFYRTSEVCQMAGISRSTLLRWFAQGIVSEPSHRDRRGWRLFNQADVKKIRDVAHEIQ